jgi:hypothetical protein
MFSKRVRAQIRSPARVRTYKPVPWRLSCMLQAGARPFEGAGDRVDRGGEQVGHLVRAESENIAQGQDCELPRRQDLLGGYEGGEQRVLYGVLGVLKGAEHPIAMHLQFSAVRLRQHSERVTVPARALEMSPAVTTAPSSPHLRSAACRFYV